MFEPLGTKPVICPECGDSYFVKPPFNSSVRCQKCRWRDGFHHDRGVKPE